MRRALWLIYFLFALRAWAGEVVLKNGDRLTGRIIRMDKSTVELETELLGKISAPWNVITKIQSDTPVYVSVDDGKAVLGKISMVDGRVEVRVKDADAPIAYPKDKIREMRSEEEQRACLRRSRVKAPGPFDGWGGSVEAAVSAPGGNSSSETFNFGLRAVRASSNDRLGIYFISIFSDTGRTPASFTNTWRGGSRYEANMGRRFYTFGFNDVEHDRFQNLDLRVVGGGGLGFRVMKTPKTLFQVFSGGSANHEDFHNGIVRRSREFVFGHDFSRQLSKTVSATESLIVYPNLSNRGQYRVNFDSTLVTRLNSWLAWQVTTSSRYISNPAPGNKNNDVLMTTGIRFMRRPESAQNVEARPELRRR